MLKDQKRPEYSRPTVRDYGTLVELTATNGLSEAEDGVGKSIHSDGSNGFIP